MTDEPKKRVVGDTGIAPRPQPSPADTEVAAILESVIYASRGESVSDFMLSFPIVRAVDDLRLERDQLRAQLAAADVARPVLPQLSEEEKNASRVEPLKAGVVGQDLAHRGQPVEVTAAERTEKDFRMNCQQRISNRCPSCGNQTLFIAEGGWLTCSWLKCPNPCLIGEIAEDYRESRSPDGDGQDSAVSVSGSAALKYTPGGTPSTGGKKRSSSNDPHSQGQSYADDPIDRKPVAGSEPADSHPLEAADVAALHASPRDLDVQFARDDAALHALIPTGWSHDVIALQPPLPREWSALVIRADGQRFRVQTAVSPTVALASALIEALQQPEAALHARPQEEQGEERIKALEAQRDKWLAAFNRSEQFQNGPTKRAEHAEAALHALRDRLQPLLEQWRAAVERELNDTWCNTQDAPIWLSIHRERADVFKKCADALDQALTD